MTPQVGEGLNEGDMEVCRAREKSEAKQGWIGMRRSIGEGRFYGGEG